MQDYELRGRVAVGMAGMDALLNEPVSWALTEFLELPTCPLLQCIDLFQQRRHPAWFAVVGSPYNHGTIETLIDGLTRSLRQKDAGMTGGEVR
jgi:hypothetical protein